MRTLCQRIFRPLPILFNVCIVVFLYGCIEDSDAVRPNIVLIMADDLGWGDVGFNGSTPAHTPNLDSLALGGIRLSRFYSASAVCSPTRSSVLTGKNPIRSGIPTANAGYLREAEVTLPEVLKDAGYATGHFGKWHLGTLTTEIRDSNRGRPGDSSHFSLPSAHGIDEFFSTEAKVPTYDPLIKPVLFDTLQGESLRYGWASVEPGEASEAYGTHYWTGQASPETDNLSGDNSRIIMDRVLPFITRSQQAGTPFLAVIWFHTPHLPVVADSLYRSRHSSLTVEEQLYYGAISAMDDQIGRLSVHLNDLNISDNTMIWFASDNGPERDTPGSAGPYRERKRSLHEGGVRVPAFIHWPGALPANLTIDASTVTSDYLPTIADFLDLPLPRDRALDGISLKPVLSGEHSVRGQAVGFYFGDQRSWVEDSLKLITKDEGQTFELYNLLRDPEEAHDVSDRYPRQVDRMRIDLAEWIVEVEADRDALSP